MSAPQVTPTPRGGDYFDSDSGDEEKQTKTTTGLVTNKWEGEDEEEDVLDSWDQDDEEKADEGTAQTQPAEKSTKKNLKKLGDKFEEKERKKRELLKEKDVAEMTPEERLADKLRRQQLQEESDLSLAKEVFGVSSSTASKILDTKEDYDKLKDDVLKCVQSGLKNANFVAFAEDLIQALCVHMTSIDIKKVHTKLGNLQIEKSKIEKGDKGKKSKGKAKIKIERDDAYSEFSAYATEEFDEFI